MLLSTAIKLLGQKGWSLQGNNTQGESIDISMGFLRRIKALLEIRSSSYFIALYVLDVLM
jgi:hypothetical protein